MTASDVLDVLDDLERLGVQAWLDGGWGVDALLGEQTREHDDLDLVLDRDALGQVIARFEVQGFEIERDLRPTALALRHPDGRGVDLHPVELLAEGGGVQIISAGESFRYEPPVTGTIAGREVPCCSVETQVSTHLGYEPDANDHEDMRRLAVRFGLRLPPPYGETASRT